MKKNFIQVTVREKGKSVPYTLDSTHPTFDDMKLALKNKQWNKVPKLVNKAKQISLETAGEVRVIGGIVQYKGTHLHNALTDRIIQFCKAGKPVKPLLMFIDNLYLNPSEKAQQEFCNWLVDNDLPITDDGEFLAYKSVNDNYTDCHSGKISNKPGTRIMMDRAVCDTDYNTQCATGYHMCSKHYGIYGARVMATKVDPRFVLSAVGGKIRTSQYEVLMELGKTQDLNKLFTEKGYSGLEKRLVVETGKERKEMIQMLLSCQSLKRTLKKKKIGIRKYGESLKKASHFRLTQLIHNYNLVEAVPADTKLYLQAGRKAANLTIGQVAKQMGVSYKKVAEMEKQESPSNNEISGYLAALSKLTGNRVITYQVAQ